MNEFERAQNDSGQNSRNQNDQGSNAEAATSHDGSLATKGISRRTVARGMAWTTPVVLSAVTAPAFAASPVLCQTRVPTSFTVDDNDIVTSVVFPEGITGTVTYQSSGYSSLTPSDSGEKNRTQFANPSRPNYDYIKLRHPEFMKKGSWVALTIDFGQDVSKLSMNLTDIDAVTGEWIDHVIVSPAPPVYAYATPPTTNQPDGMPKPFLMGAGTDLDPFRATSDFSLVLERNNGDVTMSWPGKVTAVTVKFLAVDETGNSSAGQHIGVGNFSLCA